MKIELFSLSKFTVAMAMLSFIFLAAPLKAKDSEETAKAAFAEQLIGLLNVDKNYDATYQRMLKMQDNMLDQSGLTPEQRTQREQATTAALKVIKEFANWEAIKPTFVQIYTDIFTVEELQGMIDFYNSTVGRKWLEKQPRVQTAVMQKMGDLMTSLQPKIMEAVRAAQAASSEKAAPPSESGAPAK